jgi:CheY-like chemotaxis protein
LVAHSVVLRADLVCGDRAVVGHTVELSDEGAVIQVDDEPNLGEQVRVTLSLSGLLDEPCTLDAQLIGGRIAEGPGSPGIWELRWEPGCDGERERLAELLAQVRASSGGGPLRILLVEDSAMTRQVFELGVMRLLSGRVGSLSLDCAKDGEGAWEKLLEKPYEVAIIDCLLPGIQGPELIRKLRARGLSDMAVVAMSVGGEGVRLSALEAGADLFVHKPVVVARLLESLERLGRARGTAA